MATTQRVRYSTENVGKSEAAQAFSWECPVPVNQFWDSLSYSLSRNFLNHFTDQQLEQLPINPDSSASHKEKLELLLRLLREKLAKEEALAAPQTLYEIDGERWHNFWLDIYMIQDELDLPEAEQTVRMLVEKRPDKSNLVPQHLLADHLIKMTKPVCTWLDAIKHLGRDSPQSLNARRTLVRAVWLQGPSRRAEAEMLLAEIKGITEGMKDGKFGIYQEEEMMLTDNMMADLDKEK